MVLGPAPPAAAVTLNPGDLVVSDDGEDAVFRVHPGTGAQTTISSGTNLDVPVGVAMDPHGRVLVADFDGSVIRVNPATGAQTVVSSGGSFANPIGVAVEASGKILVADVNCCGGSGGVIRVNPATGAQTVVSSGDNFASPLGVAVEASGKILVADADCCGGSQGGVIRVNPATGAQTVLSDEGSLVDPFDVAVEASGNILVVDFNCCGGDGGVIRVDRDTGAQTQASSGPSPFDPFAAFLSPRGVAVEASGDIVVADGDCCGESRGGVIRVDGSTGRQTILALGGSFSGPAGIDTVTPGVQKLTIDPAGIVAEGGNAEVEGRIECDAPERWTVAITVAQRSTGARGTAVDSGNCNGEEQTWSGVAPHGTRPAFAPGAAKMTAAARLLLAGELRDKAHASRTIQLT